MRTGTVTPDRQHPIVALRRSLCSSRREHVRLDGSDAIAEHELLVTREVRDT
jgi:hypothetical protein